MIWGSAVIFHLVAVVLKLVRTISEESRACRGRDKPFLRAQSFRLYGPRLRTQCSTTFRSVCRNPGDAAVHPDDPDSEDSSEEKAEAS